MILPPLWLGIYSCYEIAILSYMGLIDIECPSDALLGSYRRFRIRYGDLRDSLLNHINKPSSNHVIIRLTEDLFTCPNICARFSFLTYFSKWSLFWSLFLLNILKPLILLHFPGHFSGFKSHLPQFSQKAENVDLSKFSAFFIFANGMTFRSL